MEFYEYIKDQDVLAQKLLYTVYALQLQGKDKEEIIDFLYDNYAFDRDESEIVLDMLPKKYCRPPSFLKKIAYRTEAVMDRLILGN